MVGHDEEVQLGERECWTSGTRRRISGKVKEVGAAEKWRKVRIQRKPLAFRCGRRVLDLQEIPSLGWWGVKEESQHPGMESKRVGRFGVEGWGRVLVYVLNNTRDWDVVGSILETACSWKHTPWRGRNWKLEGMGSVSLLFASAASTHDTILAWFCLECLQSSCWELLRARTSCCSPWDPQYQTRCWF